MATNLDIDAALIERAIQLGGARSKRAVVQDALEEYIRHREQERILELFGQIEFEPGYDPKAGRQEPARARKKARRGRP
ncbi:MAG TPA: type II toxin-antitoxin system VapB family antitoxin [Myxococcota bacterium]|nr:type II toxin-antitoxin system VapB family antitoxin [Myxococcota bacterium]HRY93242.1 type II toxin-antitoxin system VapB family antitoxin [Myxococcota bacterium]HSA20688.1 type II toxin-antitoxin system VapB family antitoxin [Myxococcota bacterium]